MINNNPSRKAVIPTAISKLSASYLRIDIIELGLRVLFSFKVEGEGYRLVYRIAKDNLRLGHDMIADSCNPIELTRWKWENVALESNPRFINIEVICSDINIHKCRVEELRSAHQIYQTSDYPLGKTL